jgi:hypothetical protein
VPLWGAKLEPASSCDLLYVRGNDHASTFTELWNTEPLSLQDLAAPHAAAGVEADPNHKLSASSGTLHLALHASTLDVAQLVKQHQRELKNLGWDVDVVALSDKHVLSCMRNAALTTRRW